MTPTDFTNIINWLGYTEQQYLEPKKHFFHFKRKKLTRFIDFYGVERSTNFDSNWNDLMDLVDSIESKGYSFFISSYEIKIVRDYINNPYLAPKVEIMYPIDRKDKNRKNSTLASCILFLIQYNKIKLTADKQVRNDQYV